MLKFKANYGIMSDLFIITTKFVLLSIVMFTFTLFCNGITGNAVAQLSLLPEDASSTTLKSKSIGCSAAAIISYFIFHPNTNKYNLPTKFYCRYWLDVYV